MVAAQWLSRIIFGVVLAGLAPAAMGAIGPDNVLVLYNQASADGAAIASYYASVHPGVHLLGLGGLGTGEDISADDYLAYLRPQVLPALSPSIDVIVTTTGLPLRIYNSHANPGSYTDPFGVRRSVYSDTWKPYSSLESELTRIDKFSTWQQLGDQTYWIPKGAPGYPNPAANPYYKVTGAFSPATYGTRLTARLDGFTVSDVTGAIDRAQEAYKANTAPYVVVDNDPNGAANSMANLNTVLSQIGQAKIYDNTTAAVTGAPGPVIGYVSHGTHGGGLTSGYITNQLGFSLANGAVFSTYESYNANSFQPGGNRAGQGLVAQWLQIGGTVGVGNVEEPRSGPSNVANEDQMYKMLLSGYTWAEAAWSSMQQLSYVNTVVGDPLMVFQNAIAGDADLNGVVTLDDFDQWKGGYLCSNLPPNWVNGDFDGDGEITTDDFDIWKQQFVTGADLPAAAVASTPVPEPAGLWLLAVAGSLLPLAWRRRGHASN